MMVMMHIQFFFLSPLFFYFFFFFLLLKLHICTLFQIKTLKKQCFFFFFSMFLLLLHSHNCSKSNMCLCVDHKTQYEACIVVCSMQSHRMRVKCFLFQWYECVCTCSAKLKMKFLLEKGNYISGLCFVWIYYTCY